MVKIEIGKTLDEQLPFELDINDVVTGRTFVASITRWGKSWTARKFVEKVFGYCGIVLLDVEGEYWSLRDKFPLLIIGKDVPVQLETAEFMAEKILESNISVIIDLSLVEEELGKEYVNKFLRKFFFLETSMRKPYFVVVEEAEDFAGEKGIATGTCVEILRNITKKGGKRGIGILFVAHRPAWVSKGILSQCANKAIGKIEWPSDLDVLENFARIPHSTIEKLPTLGKGEFCFAGDWVKDVSFVKVGEVETRHLGFTPEVIPQAPKELESLIVNLKKSLPEVIRKVKPVVTSVSEIENKIKTELENKYKGKIETLERTAVERAERKFKVKIDELQQQLATLSRSQALQPTAPIADVLEHPIVKTRMLELPDKARDLLVKIEREPGVTREQLAAFLSTSKDTVSALIDRINRVFHATAVIGDGKPICYRSLLKRLYLTDVAKREIEELGRLQERNKALEEEVKTLRPIAQQSTTLHNEVQRLTTEKKDLSDRLDKQEIDMKELKSQNEALVKENVAYQKIKEGFSELGITALPIDEEKLKAIIEVKVRELVEEDKSTALLNEKQIEELVEKHVKNVMSQLQPKVEGAQEVIDLEHKELVINIQHAGEEHVKMTTSTDKGKILYCAKEDLSKDAEGKPKETFSWGELRGAFAENGWSISEPTLAARIRELISEGHLIKLEKGTYRLPKKVRFEIEKTKEEN